MEIIKANKTELLMILNVIDDWPPVAVEGLQSTRVNSDYCIDTPPLFVKGLSVGDIIAVNIDMEGRVKSWKHIHRSNRTTIWLLRLGSISDEAIESALKQLRLLGCFTVGLPECGCYSIDVPEHCSITVIDTLLSRFDASQIAIAYPSFRHKDD